MHQFPLKTLSPADVVGQPQDSPIFTIQFCDPGVRHLVSVHSFQDDRVILHLCFIPKALHHFFQGRVGPGGMAVRNGSTKTVPDTPNLGPNRVGNGDIVIDIYENETYRKTPDDVFELGHLFPEGLEFIPLVRTQVL